MNRAGLAASLLVMFLGAAGCAWLFSSVKNTFEMCGNDILATAVSPDSMVKAVLFQRDCGAASGFYEQISLLKNGDALPNESGNIFQADGGGQNDVRRRMVWKNNSTLQVSYPYSAKVYWKTNRHDVKTGFSATRRIRIEYK